MILILTVIFFSLFIVAASQIRLGLIIRHRFLFGLICLGLLLGVVRWLQSVWISPDSRIVVYDPNSQYPAHGLVYSLLRHSFMTQIKKPTATYTLSDYQHLLANCQLPTTSVATGAAQPNVIAIMNESFYDFAPTSDSLATQQLMPYYQRFKTEGLSGYLNTIVYGGDTSIPEFEFLTGSDVSLLPPGRQPYVYFITRQIFSLVAHYQNLGYQTLAYHPYYQVMWNRQRAYPLLGFNQSLTEPENFQNYPLLTMADSPKRSLLHSTHFLLAMPKQF